MTRHLIISKVTEALNKGIYTSVPFNRSRTNSLLLGSVIGLGITLPSEAIGDRLERFNYDVVDPAVVRIAEELTGGQRLVAMVPTVRSMAHSVVKARYSLAHAPLCLKNPLETLSWALAANDISLFKDSTLEIFKELNISPFDIDLKRLFLTFADNSGNIYSTIKQGLHGIKPTSKNLNGVQVPLLSINEDQLAAIVPAYLGIVLGYILPLPSTEVDDIHAYTMSQHSSSIYARVDELNESTIVDTEHAVAIASAIYKLRYRAVFLPETIAHNLVFSQLTETTSMMPAELYEHVDNTLRDELADDARDILESIRQETDGEAFINANQISLLECCSADSVLEVPPSRIPQFGHYESLILDKIEEDLSQLARLHEAFKSHSLQPSDLIALEHFQGRYYHMLPRNMNNVSMEDVRSGKLDKHRKYAVSQESAGLMIGGAIVAMVAGLVILFKALATIFSRTADSTAKLTEQMDKDMEVIKENNRKIAQKSVQISQNFKQISTLSNVAEQIKEFQKGTPFANRADRILGIIHKYNPAAKAPESYETNPDAVIKFIMENLTSSEKITAIMLTRKDNNKVPQVPMAFQDANKTNGMIQRISTTLDYVEKYLQTGLNFIDIKYFKEAIVDIQKDGSVIKQRLDELAKLDEDLKTEVGLINGAMEQTSAVNTSDIISLAESGSFRKAREKTDVDDATNGIKRAIRELKSNERVISKAIEDALKRGDIDDKEATQLSKYVKQVVQHIRFGITTGTRTINTYFREYAKVCVFVRDYKHLLDSILVLNTHAADNWSNELKNNAKDKS